MYYDKYLGSYSKVNTDSELDLNMKNKIYIHINTTNPILIPTSNERKIVEENGWEVSYDGMEIDL